MRKINPKSEQIDPWPKKHPLHGTFRCVRVRAIDGPYAGKSFRFYRRTVGGQALAGDFDSELRLDSHGTLVTYDLIETDDPRKWILTQRTAP